MFSNLAGLQKRIVKQSKLIDFQLIFFILKILLILSKTFKKNVM